MNDPQLDKFLNQFRAHAEEKFEFWHTNTENRSIVPEGERPCPICNKPMETEAVRQITIDVCSKHGSWLDQGELKGLLKVLSEEKKAAIDSAYERGVRDGLRRAQMYQG